MEFTPEKIEEIRAKLISHAENYPDVKALIAAGKLTKKGGYYVAADKATWDSCVGYMSAVVSGNGHFKLHRGPSAELKRTAARLKNEQT